VSGTGNSLAGDWDADSILREAAALDRVLNADDRPENASGSAKGNPHETSARS
jgi:hypothetical protein